MLMRGICCAVAAFTFASCSSELPVQREEPEAVTDVRAAPVAIIWVIHGDGDYLFHDAGGTSYTANEEVLATAKRVAEQNPTAEVFIFHQRSRRRFLFLFPVRDGEFLYYRNGRLVAHETYWRDQERSQLEPETELYRRFRVDYRGGQRNVFLYTGHEVPEKNGKGYDRSYEDRSFTITDLGAGLERFSRSFTRFDLVVLSTCFGGTPYTIGTLGPYARTIVASPDNLHLSNFDFTHMERLDLRLRDGDVPELARRLARTSFDRLTKEVQTAVSVAVYDVDRTQEYAQEVRGRYLQVLEGGTGEGVAAIDHCDCAEIPGFVTEKMNSGVEVLYRPARFGRARLKQDHSGWECWKKRVDPTIDSLVQ